VSRVQVSFLALIRIAKILVNQGILITPAGIM
jgi:hypothetical protein